MSVEKANNDELVAGLLRRLKEIDCEMMMCCGVGMDKRDAVKRMVKESIVIAKRLEETLCQKNP